MTRPRTIRAQGEGIKIQVAEWPGEGRTLLALHGMTAHGRCFDLLASALSPPHRLLALDLRGRGLSDKPPEGYSPAHHLRDILSVMDHLELPSAVIMGHSLGAYLALAFAAAHPERTQGLILLDGGAQLSAEQWAKVALAIRPSMERLGLTFPSVEAYLEHARASPLLRPWNKAMETYFRYECETVEKGVRSRMRPETAQEEAANLVSADFSAYPSRVRAPVLILRAAKGMLSDDDLVMPEPETEALSLALGGGARVISLGNVNHYDIIFQPSPQRDQAIIEFLQDLGPAPDQKV